LAPVGWTAGFDESDIPSNALKPCRFWEVGIQELDEVRVEVAVVNADTDAIRIKRVKMKYVSKVCQTRKALKASVVCRVESRFSGKARE
jgi:hypothetical protein